MMKIQKDCIPQAIIMHQCPDGLLDGISVSAMDPKTNNTEGPVWQELSELFFYYCKRAKNACFGISNMKRIKAMREEMAFRLDVPPRELRRLGQGHEGVVFVQNMMVYKLFYDSLTNLDILNVVAGLSDKSDLILPITISKMGQYDVVSHPYLQAGHCTPSMKEIKEFLLVCKERNILFWDFKRDNFISLNGISKLVDYGVSFEPYDDLIFKQSCIKAYIFVKYPRIKPWRYKHICKQIDKGFYPNQLLSIPIDELLSHDNIVEFLFK